MGLRPSDACKAQVVRPTIGLVALARQRGTLKAAAPVYRALRDAGLFLAPALIKAVLAQFDEEP
jgi:predicted nucleic acid-binding protein